MFSAESWARAFTGTVSRETADAALDALKAFCAAAVSIPGDLSGAGSAARIAPLVDAALKRADFDCGTDLACAFARNFFLLMIRRGCFRRYAAIVGRIQELINEKKGVAEAALETPFEPDEAFLESVKQSLVRKTGANEVNLTVRTVPDLIGGVRLRVGSVLFDGSLKAALERMTAELSSPPQEVS